jgi:hypothetical protein
VSATKSRVGPYRSSQCDRDFSLQFDHKSLHLITLRFSNAIQLDVLNLYKAAGTFSKVSCLPNYQSSCEQDC